MGITMDEPTRLLGGYLYWLNLPDHPPQDQPPLLGIVTGWAPKLLRIPLFRDHLIWRQQWKDHVASYILDRLPGETIDQLFFLARLGVIPFGIFTALLMWHWSRQLLSRTAALLVVTTFVLLPEVRAHGALITSDMMTTFAYLLAAYRAWRYWLEPSLRQAAWLGLAAGFAVLAKLSLLIVPPLAACVVIARMLLDRRARRRGPAALLLVTVLCWLVVTAAYKFDTRRFTWAELQDIERQREYSPALVRLMAPLTVIPTPRELQLGVRLLGGYYRDGSWTYFFGKIYDHGHWAYYPACLALKEPIGFQLLVVIGTVAIFRRWQRIRSISDAAFILVPALIYLGFAMQSPTQLGIRLILPVVGCLVLVAGYGIDWLLQSKRGRLVVAGALAFTFISTARIFPHDMAYFNEWAGGPERGWRYLTDSNIDWGHLWPELKKYMVKHGIKQVRAFPFGYDKLHRYFQPGEVELEPSPWTPEKLDTKTYVPKPGIYAVSASLLSGQYYPPVFRTYLHYFRQREPDDRVGYGMFIYFVPDRAQADHL